MMVLKGELQKTFAGLELHEGAHCIDTMMRDFVLKAKHACEPMHSLAWRPCHDASNNTDIQSIVRQANAHRFLANTSLVGPISMDVLVLVTLLFNLRLYL